MDRLNRTCTCTCICLLLALSFILIGLVSRQVDDNQKQIEDRVTALERASIQHQGLSTEELDKCVEKHIKEYLHFAIDRD